MAEEAVEIKRTVGRNADCLGDVFAKHYLVVDDFHSATAENERRTDDERITELLSALYRAVDVAGHHRLGHGNAELVHDGVEKVAVFRVVDRIDRGAENLAAGLLKTAGDVERSLTAELDDNPGRLFVLVDLQNVLDRDRLEIQLVGSVVVG